MLGAAIRYLVVQRRPGEITRRRPGGWCIRPLAGGRPCKSRRDGNACCDEQAFADADPIVSHLPRPNHAIAVRR
jgi:hypothetical protein